MDLLEWLIGSDAETHSSAKPPEFLSGHNSKSVVKTQSANSPVVSSAESKSTDTPQPQRYSLTPLESRIKNLILNVYSHKWIPEEEEEESHEVASQNLTRTLDEQHKRLHILPSAEREEGLKLNLEAAADSDLSVELASDEEEAQTLGLGRLASLPSHLLRVSPIGGESFTFDSNSTPLPAHIKRPELPQKSEGERTSNFPVEFDLEEQEHISRLAPEGISDSDTDHPLLLASSSTSHLLTKQQLPSLQQIGRRDHKHLSVSLKMSDIHSLASVGSLNDEEVTSVPFFSAEDRNVNPSDSEIPQVVPSMHQDEAPYANFYASSKDPGVPNVPSALRPSAGALPYSAEDPDTNFSLLYSFSDSSYKSKLNKGPSKPRSQVVESFGVSVDTYHQPSRSQPPRSLPQPSLSEKKASSVGDETDKVLHFPKPRFVSESDQHSAEEKESSNDRSSDGGNEKGDEEKEEEERNSSTPVFDDTNEEEDLSKEATPVPEIPSSMSQEAAAPDRSQPLAGGQAQALIDHTGVGPFESVPHQSTPQLMGSDSVDSPFQVASISGGTPARYGESQPVSEEARDNRLTSKASEKEREDIELPGMDQPSYRVSRLDSDIETSSVVSVQELTETILSEHRQPLQSGTTTPTDPSGRIPFSLPLFQPHTTEGTASSTTPTQASLPSRQTPTIGTEKPPSIARTPPRLPSLQASSRLPQHIQPSPKLPPKRSSPLPTRHTRESSPYSDVSDGSSLLVQPVRDSTQLPAGSSKRPESAVVERPREHVIETEEDEATRKEVQSLEDELTKALQDKANLEGQLESVMDECKVTMKDRADLQSKLARAETELAATAEALEREKIKSTDIRAKRVPPPQVSAQVVSEEVKEELMTTKSELEREKETVASLKSEVAKEKQNTRKLQNSLEWAKQSLDEQQSSASQLQEKVKDLQSTVDQKSSELEEAGAKISSLEASYGALQGTKDWLHGQLENVLEEKKKLQDEWRDSKANAIAQSMKAEQLLKDNSMLQQQVAQLQQGILHDKAKLVNELEAIEADVLSREDSYSHLVAEKSQLEDIVRRKEDTLEKLNSDLAKAHVEKEELEQKMEDSEMQNDVLSHTVEDLERQREVLAKKLSLAGQEIDVKSSDVKEMEKARASLQERLKQLDAALISKDGTCHGLTDANEFLKNELEAVKKDRDQLEEELDKTKEEMASLKADLKSAKDTSRGKETEVKSLAQLQEASSAESQALKDRLAEKEWKLEEKTSELESLEAQSGELLGQFKALQGRFQSIAADTGSFQESVEEKDRVIAHFASEKDKAEQELSALKEESEQLKNRLNQLEHDNARLEGEVEASSSGGLEEFQKAIKDKSQLQAELNSLKLGQQHESIRAQAKANRLESDIITLKKASDSAQEELEMALQRKEEQLGKIEEEKVKVESALREWKNKFEHARKDKERLQSSIESHKPVNGTVEALTARCEQLTQQNQALGEKLKQEATQRAEIERASGMVATKLKQNAREEEKKLQRQIRDLSLDVERLRGRLNGMNTTQAAMREHAASLEAALAKKESSLVKISAQVQNVLEDKEFEDQESASKIALLEKKSEDVMREREAWKTKAQNEKKKLEELGQQLCQKEMELADIKSLLDQTSQSGRSIPHLEEKIAEIAIEKDGLLSRINDFKTELTIARTAMDMTKKDLTDRSSQVNILKKELDMAKSHRIQAEKEMKQLHDQLKGAEERHNLEVGKLRNELRRERESSVMEDREADSKPGLFEMSLSTIGTEDVDKAHSGMSLLCLVDVHNYARGREWVIIG